MPILRIICFFIVLFILAGTAQYYLQYRERYNDNSSFQIINFYKEEKDSLDAVFVGSSCCFSYYSPLFAYESHGIKTANYSSSGMGMLAYRYAIEEVRKHQKDALIVLTVTPNYEMQYLGVHFMSDYMPFSKNKIDFLVKYFTQDGESILNSIGFFVPLIEYHDRWSEMEASDFIIDDGTKGATQHKYYLSVINDVTNAYHFTNKKADMPEMMSYFMTDLLDYCDEKNENNIIFLLPPRTYSEDEYAQMNSLSELISSRGYDVLDLRDKIEDIQLLTDQDYYDIYHTNVHGSIKYTDYLARYVMMKRECDTSRDRKWDMAVEKYKTIISNYVLDIESDSSQHDYSLNRPEIVSVKQNEGNVHIVWNNEDEVDGYYVYRKDDAGFVRVSDEVINKEYTDNEVKTGKEYIYTIVPFIRENGHILYGNYDYKGASVEVKQ